MAKDACVAKSTVCQLVNGTTSPLYKTLDRIVSRLEFQIARKLNAREVFSQDGQYPTSFVCQLVGCSGCLPEFAYLPDGSIKSEWAEVQPGKWTGDNLELEGSRR